MQPLTAPPRDGFTEAQVHDLLVAPDLAVDYGLELLAPDLAFVEDISADVSGGKVSRDNYADIAGTLELTISRELAWGKDRVKPYQLLSSAIVGVQCRFNLGVFILTTPDLPLDPYPPTYVVTGFDQIYLLQGFIQDSYAVAVGANVLDAVRAAVVSAGVPAPVLLDSSAAAKTLSSALVWPQTSSDNPTWLGVINDLLASVGYRGIWADWDGNLRSGPFVTPSERVAEFVFRVGDLVEGVVAAERVVTNDLWNKPNAWRFVQNGLLVPPVEGAGMYTTVNADVGASSQASLGRVVAGPVVYLDAVDQAALVVQGDRIKAAEMRSSEMITAKLSPFPIAAHFDRATFSDPQLGGDREVLCRSWSLPLTGEDMEYLMETVDV